MGNQQQLPVDENNYKYYSEKDITNLISRMMLKRNQPTFSETINFNDATLSLDDEFVGGYNLKGGNYKFGNKSEVLICTKTPCYSLDIGKVYDCNKEIAQIPGNTLKHNTYMFDALNLTLEINVLNNKEQREIEPLEMNNLEFGIPMSNESLEKKMDDEFHFIQSTIAMIIRNCMILIGDFKLNVILHINQLPTTIPKLIKNITRKASTTVTDEMVNKILNIQIVNKPIPGQDSYINRTSYITTTKDEMKIQAQNFINGQTNKLHIKTDSSEHQIFMDVIKLVAKKRIALDIPLTYGNEYGVGETPISELNKIFVYIDKNQYYPNFVSFVKLAEQYPSITFVISLSDGAENPYRNDKTDQEVFVPIREQYKEKIEEATKKHSNLIVLKKDQAIIQHIKSENIDKIYLIETVKAIPHTQLSNDIKKTSQSLQKKPSIALIFGSESEGTSIEIMEFLNEPVNLDRVQNLIINSYSPYLRKYGASDKRAPSDCTKDAIQSYSLNLSSCVATILATFN
jgi:hypothetical protein